jgi:hypothetical protein
MFNSGRHYTLSYRKLWTTNNCNVKYHIKLIPTAMLSHYTVQIDNTLSMICLFDLSTIPF